MEIFFGISVVLSALLGFFAGGPIGIFIGGIFGCLLYIGVFLTRIWFLVEEKKLQKEWEEKIRDIE